MPAPDRLRTRQRAQIKPLIDELNRRVPRGHDRLGEQIGMKGYQIGRILGEALPSPTYLDITTLLRAANLTPNAAARLVGLYEGPDYDEQASPESAYEERILNLLRNAQLTTDQKLLFVQMLEATLLGLSSHRFLETRLAEQDEQMEALEEEPTRRRKVAKAR